MNPITDGQQPSWRLWGEEKIPGAIYTVYLKKVRYHPSSSVSFEDAEDAISHLEWETVRIRIVKAGNLERLVESLASDTGELESAYINIFLSTYRSFATTQQVLTLIIERYKLLDTNKIDMLDEMREIHRKTLVQALMVWLDMHPEDFFDPPQFLALHQVVEFAKRYLPGSMLEMRAKHKLEKCHREENAKTSIFMSSSPETVWYSRQLDSDEYDLLTSPPYEFQEIDEQHFAYQLTWMDAELFRRLIPHHCLGSMWSRRDKPKGWNGSTSTMDSLCGGPFTNSTNTVSATVNQFNAVSSRVISTVLSGLELDPLDRALIITKWIDIAQELRFVKNFSSLKAITAALQSNAIYRLEKVWNTVPREKVEVFSELARIFSEENNQLNCRKLLLKEGSAKFADSVGEDDRQLTKLMQRQLSNPTQHCTIQGTVPYLGTFLTDLTMIDTAIPDLLPDGLINFDKRRKEFEVLAQIQLLQSSAKNYVFEPDPRFLAWFNGVNILDDNESYELSCLIEPPSLNKRPTLLHKSRSVENHLGHRKTNSTSSTSTSSSSQFYDAPASELSSASSTYQTTPLHQQNGVSELKGSLMRMNLSMPSLTNYSPSTPTSAGSTVLASSTPDGHLLSPSTPLLQVPEFYIIRVSIEQMDKNAQQGLNVYKSIMLSDRDHTRTVISNAMMKHCITGSPDQFTLSQLLPNGEITFPASANVYYAINTSFDLNFILRPRPDDSTPPLGTKKSKVGVPLVRRLLNGNNTNGVTSPVT